MSDKRIKVSIVTPTYNGEKFIGDTIRSVLNQTYKNFELIIVDDCSTDNTRKIVKSFSDKRIIYFRNDKNQGGAYCRNLAISKATGDYIAFLDGDDLWHKEKLERQLKFMLEKNASFSCTDYELIDENGQKLGIKVTSPKFITHRMFKMVDYAGCLTVMYKRSVYPDLAIPNTIRKRNDYALWLKLSEKANCYALQETLSYYRKSSNSISSGKKVKLLKYHAQVFSELYGFSFFKSWYYAFRNAYYNLQKRRKYHQPIIVDKEKENRKNRILASIGFVFVNISAVATLFIYGNSKNIVKNEATIMTAYNFSKSYDGVHINVKASKDSVIDYASADTMCREFYARRDKLHPYCMVDESFTLTFRGSEHIAKPYSSPVYSDSAETEYLGLPLYRDDFPIKKGPQYGADFAAYIPSSIADQILIDLNLHSYDEIFEIDEPFLFRKDKYEYMMSINNIYLNNETPNWDYKEPTTDYYKTFIKYNKDAIFTYAKTIFDNSQNTSVGFDSEVNYDNIKSIVNKSVLTSSRAIDIKLTADNKTTKTFTYNRSDLKTDLADPTSIASYVCFGILILLNVALISSFEELKNKLMIPCFVIAGLTAIFIFVGEILKTIFSLAIWPFTFFNVFGIALAFIYILNLFIVALLYMKEEKNVGEVKK